MKKYIFNRNEFTWAEEFYDIIKKKMELPDYFGCNADALWDMLTGYIDTPCEIVLVGFGQEENVYNKNFLQRIISCFEDAAKEYPDIPEEELAVFDSVLERMQEKARKIIEGQEDVK